MFLTLLQDCKDHHFYTTARRIMLIGTRGQTVALLAYSSQFVQHPSFTAQIAMIVFHLHFGIIPTSFPVSVHSEGSIRRHYYIETVMKRRGNSLVNIATQCTTREQNKICDNDHAKWARKDFFLS